MCLRVASEAEPTVLLEVERDARHDVAGAYIRGHSSFWREGVQPKSDV